MGRIELNTAIRAQAGFSLRTVSELQPRRIGIQITSEEHAERTARENEGMAEVIGTETRSLFSFPGGEYPPTLLHYVIRRRSSHRPELDNPVGEFDPCSRYPSFFH
jgi:hypothetical protein